VRLLLVEYFGEQPPAVTEIKAERRLVAAYDYEIWPQKGGDIERETEKKKQK
jgi:hypothetical protein